MALFISLCGFVALAGIPVALLRHRLRMRTFHIEWGESVQTVSMLLCFLLLLVAGWLDSSAFVVYFLALFFVVAVLTEFILKPQSRSTH